MGNSILRKLMAVLLTLALVMTFTVVAFADTTSPGEGSEEPGTKPAPAAKIVAKETVGDADARTMKVNYKGENAEKYKIAYRVKGGKWKYTTTRNKTYTLKNLKAKGLYQIKVAAINKDGKESKYSRVSYRYVRKVVYTAKSTAKGKITLKASKQSGVTGYQIKYSTKKNMSGAKTIKVTSSKALNKTLKGLKSGKTYYIQIRPLKKVGSTTYLGIIQTIKKVKVK